MSAFVREHERTPRQTDHNGAEILVRPLNAALGLFGRAYPAGYGHTDYSRRSKWRRSRTEVLPQFQSYGSYNSTRTPEMASRMSTAMIDVWFETLDQTQKQGLEWMLYEVLRATAELHRNLTGH